MSKGFLTADQREQMSTYPKELSSADIGRFLRSPKQTFMKFPGSVATRTA